MSRRPLALLTLLCTAVLALLGTAAVAGASTSTLYPRVTRVSPMRLAIGQTLTVRGSNFLTGTGRNTVVFVRSGGRAVFVRAGRSTSRTMQVKLPSKLLRFLSLNNGAPVPTKFKLRVLARRFGLSFTPSSMSPTVTPNEGGPTSAPTVDRCNTSDPNGDADGDLLSNALEARIHTDPCNADTDGDGISDGYEYESALDFNSRALPYPGKRPYPNALDPSDANADHDGDGLTLADEFHAWVKYGGHRFPLNYSDGTQSSGGPMSVTSDTAYLDFNHDGMLTDDEKDIDGDGLGNWVEVHGPGQPAWWQARYKNEAPYTLRAFAGTDWLDPDTDGDGLKDGADDTDHDGYTDGREMMDGERTGGLWVQPFNPCLPDPTSPVCSKHPPLDNPWEPFKSGWTEQPPLAWPRCTATPSKPASLGCPATTKP